MPKAYIVVNLEVKDPDTYAEYAKQVPPTVEKYGGRYLARGGKVEAIEGDAPRSRNVILEFPSFEQAKAWYHSDEYQPLAALRQSASEGSSYLVEGFEG